MKINKWIAGGLVILTGFIFACSGEDAENKAKSDIPDIVVLPGEDTTARQKDEFDKRKNVLTAKNAAIYKKVSKTVKGISYFTVTKEGLLFVRKSKAELYSTDGKYDNRVLFGLVDENGKVMLPMDCEQISNPGFIAKNTVEFKQNGKYGLYNYSDKSIVPAKYDVIYPSKIMAYVAIGEIGGKLYKIYDDGSQKAFTNEENAPNYFNLLKDFRFNYQSKFFAWWYNVEEFKYMEEGYGSSGSGIIMTPSYLNQLKVFPNFIREVYQEEDSLDLEPVTQIKRSENVIALTTNTFRLIAEARGYTDNKKSLITIDKSNRVISSVELFTIDEFSLTDANDNAMPSFKFLNDSLIEVKNYVYNEREDEFNSLMPYTYRTKYEYYSIDKSGKITSLGNGNYPMISAIDLSRNHFKGSFFRYLTQFEVEELEASGTELDGEGYQLTDHLSIQDIEFMMNELYAYKGMKFTDPELSNYFSQFSWYKPKFKNVDSKLTEVEKRNIAMIKRYLKDIKSNPSKFIHSKVDESNAAG